MKPDALNAAASAAAAGHDRRAALVALRGALVDRAEAQHVVREPGRDREARVDHRAELARRLEPAAVPAALRGAARRSRRTRPRREKPAGVPIGPGYVERPSMSAARQPGVLDRGEAAVERQLQRVAERAAGRCRTGRRRVMHARRSMIVVLVHRRVTPVGLEQRDVDVAVGIGMVLERDAHRHADARSSSCAQFTRLVVSRTDGCSTISTIATTYGSSGPGIHGLVVDRVRRERRPARHRLGLRCSSTGTSGRSAAAGGCSSRSPGTARTAARRARRRSRSRGCCR